MALEYKVLACNSQTNEIIEEIPWNSLTYSEGLNAAGQISLVLPLRHPKILQSVIYPWVTSIYIQRNDEIRTGGFVVSCTPNTSDGTLNVNCAGLLVYTAARTQNITKTFNPTDDQTSIVAKWFIDKMLADYDIGWAVDCPASGISRDWETFYSYEHREYSSIFERISQTENGFDFAVQSQFEAGVIVDTFRTFYPKRGRRTGLSWNKYTAGEPGSNIDIVSAPHDGLTQANVVHMLGNGEGYGMLTATATYPGGMGVDMTPMLEKTFTDKSRDIQPEVDLRAAELLLLSREPRVSATLQLKESDDDTSLSSFDLGDEISIVAEDGWLTLSGWWEVTDYNVSVTNSNIEDVSVNVTKVVY